MTHNSHPFCLRTLIAPLITTPIGSACDPRLPSFLFENTDSAYDLQLPSVAPVTNAFHPFCLRTLIHVAPMTHNSHPFCLRTLIAPLNTTPIGSACDSQLPAFLFENTDSAYDSQLPSIAPVTHAFHPVCLRTLIAPLITTPIGSACDPRLPSFLFENTDSAYDSQLPSIAPVTYDSHPFCLRTLIAPMTHKISKKAKIRNRYNQGPHMTQDTPWESDKTQENITYKRAKMLALSQQVTTRLQ